MSYLGDNHLLCVAGEHYRGKLDAKGKAAFSFKYLLVYSFRVKSIKDALYPSGWPASFSCSLQILDEKCVEFSSELNGTLLRFLQWILKELEPTYCPKVWKCCLVHFEYERVNGDWCRVSSNRNGLLNSPLKIGKNRNLFWISYIIRWPPITPHSHPLPLHQTRWVTKITLDFINLF